MRRLLPGLAVAALVALLILGVFGTLFGATLAAGEVRRAPAILPAVALIVLLRGAAALPAAAGWAVLGALGAVAWRGAAGMLGTEGWLPGEDTGPAGTLAEAAWLALVAVLAWRGASPAWLGPGLALLVATTRIGSYGQVLVPVLWEDTLREAALLATSILAGFAAGVITMLLAGWALAILVRIPTALVAPGRLLAALAAAAAIGHMLQL
jgi:hypothetical protein